MTGNNRIVLIIDDDARNIFALSAVLKSHGFNSKSASGAIEGIQIIQTNKEVGIVLLDMMMPEMDGYEAITRIREGGHVDLPIIAVTAQAMVGDREKCLDAGANGYISKPVDVDELLKQLNRYLS